MAVHGSAWQCRGSAEAVQRQCMAVNGVERSSRSHARNPLESRVYELVRAIGCHCAKLGRHPRALQQWKSRAS
jgi:hypothetical protein